ncbi:hypothetical protein GCHA_2743 [Paraglaciecola chathamensis S18K6]|uniref:Uncharacterized protein n=1 Tax=Paraglaciecola chathamensis S18K6 TaxID=1127672 RepID=A0AAV3V0W2_9ALTE|nr:hypothetical protein GCHA_2743 [Paraglaciecola chathamensis S18K6]
MKVNGHSQKGLTPVGSKKSSKHKLRIINALQPPTLWRNAKT